MTSQIRAMEMSLLSRVSGLSFRDEERGTAHAERNQLWWFQGRNFQGVRRVMAPSIIRPGEVLLKRVPEQTQASLESLLAANMFISAL